MNERHGALVEYVSRNGKVEVNELATYLNTSQVTIRKDLDYLAQKGILKRERGFAVLNDTDDINYRMAFYYDIKCKIAKVASEFVEDGESVLIEAGSICALFAEELAKQKHNITIITNSAHVANYVRDYDSVEIILLGGNYQKKRQAMVGPLTKESVKAFNVDKIFLGTDGYDRDKGFTGNDLLRVDTLQSMIAAAKHTYVLAESQKFQKTATICFLRFHEVTHLITDEKLALEDKQILERNGVAVTMV